jgi:phosphoglycerate dehydrogenase-like enzyme
VAAPSRTLVLVLASPKDPGLAALARVPPGVATVAGDRFEDFAGAAPRADAILYLSGGRSLLEQVWRAAPKVRWIHSRPAGVDSFLFPALAASAVPLTNSRGVFSHALAEFVVGAVFFFEKDFRRLVRSQAAELWDQFEPGVVRGRTLGIVGFGDIGRAVAELARPLGMEILAVRRHPGPEPAVQRVLGPKELPEMLPLCDYLVVATPLTEETRGLIGAAEIRLLKPTAVLINIARGPVVDEWPLVEALQDHRLRGAALDVFDEEPLPVGHPFYRLESVLLSPHNADRTSGWQLAAMEVFLENLERFLHDRPLRNPVDKSRGY